MVVGDAVVVGVVGEAVVVVVVGEAVVVVVVTRAGGCWPPGRQKPDCRASGRGWLQLGPLGGLSAGN